MRNWSSYEKNLLLQHKKLVDDLSIYGQRPVEYIVGEVEFDGLILKIDERALIPRIETVELVTKACTWLNSRPGTKVVDVGCGSGAIGLAIWNRCKQIELCEVDISEQAVALTSENARLLNCPAKVVCSDLLSKLDGQYDLVAANLPYIASEKVEGLAQMVKDFEPRSALDGGIHGTEIIQRLLDQLVTKLAPGGLAILEIDESHRLENFRIAKNFDAKIELDSFGKNRFLEISSI